MKYCPKCGAGISNSNLGKCPMCDADLAAESVPSDLLTKAELPTRWAAVLCVILIVNALIALAERIMVSMRGSDYYLDIYLKQGLNLEPMENLLRDCVIVSVIITALAVYGIVKRKKIGPRAIYVLHGWVITSYITYFMNMYEITAEIGGMSFMVPVQVALHAVMLIVNIKYFQKRKNVYDDIF